MPRFAYVNGRYLRHAEATVHIEDRGYQFADGVYEVIHVRAGRMIDAEPHFDRFDRSLAELSIKAPMSRAALRLVLGELLALNGIGNGLLYFQATRGVAPRDHKFPQASRTSLVATAKHLKPLAPEALEKGVAVITIPDIRWARCDIKSLALLPNVLGKQQAAEAGAFEAWQVDESGHVTEGTSTNAWIVTAQGRVTTRPLGNEILPGIVRRALVGILAAMDVGFDQRPFTLEELRQAKEAFLTASSGFLLPVTRVDGAAVGDGKVGSLARELRQRLDAEIARQSAA
jgi:D-alanine transaminase